MHAISLCINSFSEKQRVYIIEKTRCFSENEFIHNDIMYQHI